MTILSRIISSSIVCGVLAAGCLSTPPTEDTSVGQSEQALETLQERLVTYYSEPALINVVGSCFGPYKCFGPKGTTCTGIKTAYYTVEWFDCGLE